MTCLGISLEAATFPSQGEQTICGQQHEKCGKSMQTSLIPTS
jgi:hypothetical protein